MPPWCPPTCLWNRDFISNRVHSFKGFHWSFRIRGGCLTQSRLFRKVFKFGEYWPLEFYFLTLISLESDFGFIKTVTPNTGLHACCFCVKERWGGGRVLRWEKWMHPCGRLRTDKTFSFFTSKLQSIFNQPHPHTSLRAPSHCLLHREHCFCYLFRNNRLLSFWLNNEIPE